MVVVHVQGATSNAKVYGYVVISDVGNKNFAGHHSKLYQMN